jgi:hypothetical protein
MHERGKIIVEKRWAARKDGNIGMSLRPLWKEDESGDNQLNK